ncbi:hypothetical protein SPI_09082 [Niveomyces insectorum RCEF 264]|uniref:HNH nuclease domain-containing protein n=1 Tax=Niveomyces insectorum RCEF 264 TaxID=1081102 RepID=A0A162K6V4_9HYPO|nr:hypothetical protein SPI_09082 [Niveomyces insectorum RCEF 264]
MASPVPHHRHQASLESVIDPKAPPPLDPAQRAHAARVLYRIIEHFDALDNDDSGNRSRSRTYSRPRLVRYTYEYVLSDESRDLFLRAFFKAMALALDGHGLSGDRELDFEVLKPLFVDYADYLMDNFFLPLKASTRRTPQPSPAFHSAVLRAQGSEAPAFVGTPERLSSLRGTCLVRDRHRCVITRKFCAAEYTERFKKYGDEAHDDHGVLLSEVDQFATLEDQSREAALAILNMFDAGVAHLIQGVDIDRPRNALTLTHEMHQQFGAFEVYFSAVQGEYNTYRIESFLPPRLSATFGMPVVRTLFVTDARTIDPPSPRLLAVHRAIAHILHLSGAGDYIDAILRDMEDSIVRADGSSELGRMVSLGLGEWPTRAVY